MKCGPQTTAEAASKSLFEMEKSQSQIQPTKSESPLSQDVWGAQKNMLYQNITRKHKVDKSGKLFLIIPWKTVETFQGESLF